MADQTTDNVSIPVQYRIPKWLDAEAKSYAQVQKRNKSQQMAFWTELGNLCQKHPELSGANLIQLMQGMNEVKFGLERPLDLASRSKNA